MSPSEPTHGKMRCPRCGAEMNHHAEKVMRADSSESQTDQAFGGVIIKLHSCPACGAAAAE